MNQERPEYILNSHERDLFIKYFSTEEIMNGTSFKKNLKQDYSLMIGNIWMMAEDEGDGFEIYWDDSKDDLLINKLVENKSIILSDDFFEEMKDLKVDFNKGNVFGYNFFISYLKRQDGFVMDLKKLQSLDLNFNYYNLIEKKSLGDYFFENFPTKFMMGENASPSQEVAKIKLEIFSHIFKIWSKNIESEEDIDKSIDGYYRSKNDFESYLNKRTDGARIKTEEDFLEEISKKGYTNVLSQVQINHLIDMMNELEKNTLIAKVTALKEDSSDVEKYFSLRKKLNQKVIQDEPVKRKKI